MHASRCLTAEAVVVAARANGCIDLEFQPAAGCAGCAGTCLWKRLQSTRIERLHAPGVFRTGTRVSVSLPERRVLLASSGTTGLWGLDPETGAELWRRSLPATAVSKPVVVSGALLIAASRLGLFLVHPLGGELIDGIHMADGSSMTPAAYGSRAFVMTNGGTLLGLHVASPI
jgi:hypothetical protein